MLNGFSRTELLLGKKAMEKLKASRVAVFGLGGVGSYAAEALARSGVGSIDLFDSDRISLTNLNRQLLATHRTLGRKKVEAMKERILEINPACCVGSFDCFYAEDNAESFDLAKYDYIIDAIDTVSSKLTLIERARKSGVPIISCMGAGNKLDPTGFKVADIYRTSVCPLAKVMRRALRARGIMSLKVVYSEEPAMHPAGGETDADSGFPPDKEGGGPAKRHVPGSVSFVPPVAGFILASEAIKDLIGDLHDG